MYIYYYKLSLFSSSCFTDICVNYLLEKVYTFLCADVVVSIFYLTSAFKYLDCMCIHHDKFRLLQM